MSERADNLLDFDGVDDVIEGNYDDVSGLQDDIDSELAQMFADFDGGDLDQLEVRVYRAKEGKGKLAYVFSCLPSELPILDKLRDEYSGGDFEVRLLKNKKIFRRFQVCVEAPVKIAAVNPPSESASLASAMTEGFTRLGELMISANKPVEVQNPMDMVQMQAGMMQNMIAMKELMGGEKKQSPVSQLKELMELKKMVTGEDEADKEANTNDVLVSLIENVMPALTSPAALEKPLSVGQPKSKQPPNNESVKSPDNQKDKNMKMQLMYLCSMAKKNVDPEPYAQMTIDNTPENKLEELLDFVSDEENSFKSMVSVYGKVGEYREWFSELGECVKEILTGGENVATLDEEKDPQDNVDVSIKSAETEPEEIKIEADDHPGRKVGNFSDSENNEGTG